jgi:hypothetical protein
VESAQQLRLRSRVKERDWLSVHAMPMQSARPASSSAISVRRI